ncbi:MAG: ESPR-type extended signal peptide-containing protein [Acidaminococcus sp.]|uniref:ESPR-type extended signal peptide-containing protein n=1 Tax=Acidaminococcus sp. TaxID=1872103 RepID=UPI003F15396B
MNKIYKVIWSKVRSAWVVVSEITRNHGAKSRSIHTGTKLTGAGLAFAILLSIGLGGTAQAATVSTSVNPSNDRFNRLYFGWDSDNGAVSLGAPSSLNNLPQYALTIGNVDFNALGDYATAIGYNASAADRAMAIGYNSSAVAGTIALGEGSKTSTSNAARQQGYMPWEGSSLGNVQNSTFKTALSGAAWKSTGGAFSIGDVTDSDSTKWITRQISGVAAGTQDTDAVNLAQLKASMTTLSSTDGSVTLTQTYNNDGSRTYDLSVESTGSDTGSHFASFGKTSATDTDDTVKTYSNYNNDGATGTQSTAIGVGASATTQGTAVGNGAAASGQAGTAVGISSTANGVSSVAIGQSASAQNDNAIAIGHSAVSYNNAVAIGYNAEARNEKSIHIGSMSTTGTQDGSGSVSLGYDATATGAGAASLGYKASASGTDAVAVGQDSSSTGAGSVALGYQAKSTKDHATAVGTTAEANTGEGTAVGYGAKVNGTKGLALGSGAYVSAETGSKSSVALGAGSAVNSGDTVGTSSMTIKDTYGSTTTTSTTYKFAGASPVGTVSVGSGSGTSEQTRTITHVAAGRVSSTSTDAINGSQLYGITQSLEKVEKNVADTATKYFSVNASNTAAGSNYQNDGAHGSSSLAAGDRAAAYGTGSVAIGLSSLAGKTTDNTETYASIAIGPYAKAQGAGSIALGNSTQASGFGSLALGGGAKVTSFGGVALGGTTSTTASGGVALGTGSQASTAPGVAGYLSSRKAANQADSVWTSTIGAVSVGGGTFKVGSETKTYTRQITNLAAGTADTDAVNVAQLKAVEQEGISLTGNDSQKVTQALGGNFNITGGLTGDALKDGKASTANLGVRKNAAGDGLEVVMTTTPTFDTVTANTNITVKNSSTEAGTSDISLSGTGLSMGSKKITGLAAGTDTTDAVNFGQLSAVSSDLSAFEKKTIQVGGNAGGTISRKLGENPILIQGAGTKDNVKYSGTNLKTYVDQDGVLQILLDKELLEDRIDVGSVLANPTDSRVNYPVVMGTDNTDATIGYVGINGRNGTSAVITSYAGSPIPGSDFNYTDSEGKSRMTRLEYTDQAGHTHHVATLTDGLTFGGDNSKVQIDSKSETVTGTNVISRKLRAKEYGKDTTTNYLQIKGGADAAKLSDGNIGVQASSADGSLTVKLSQELTNLTSAQFGTTTIDGSGLTLGTGTKTISLTANGLNNGGQKVTNVKAGDISTTSKDAINGSQLTNILNADGTAKGISFRADGAAGSHTNPTSVAIGGTVTLKGAGGDSTHKNLSTSVTDHGELTVTMAPEIQENKIYVGTQIAAADSPTGNVNYPVILGQNTVGTDTYGYVGIKGKNNTQAYLTADQDTSGSTRLDYLDASNNAHLVALTSDGYTFAGDTGTANTLALNSTLSITGGVTNTENLTAGNIGVVSSGSGGLTVELAKDLTNLTSATFGSGDNTTTVNGSSITAPAYKVGSNTYLDSNGLNANNQKVQNVLAGTLSDTSTDAVNGSQLHATNQNVAANTTSISGLTTRLDNAGLTFAGDTGSTTKKLNSTLTLTGGETSADNLTLLTDKNVGVIADTDGKVEVRLAKALTGMQSATFVGTDFTSMVTGNGITITPNSTAGTATGISLTKDNISMGNRVINDVGDGTVAADSKQAVNGSQLYTVKTTAEAAQTEAAKHNTVSANDGNLTVETATSSTTGGTEYKLKLNSTLTLGTGDNQIVLDGTDGGDTKIGKSITLNAGTGAIQATSLTTTGQISANGGLKVNDVQISPTTNTITGLDNTTFNQNSIQSDRAATEGQLKSLVDQISAGTVTGGTTEVVAGSNTNVSSSTANKVTTYTVNVDTELTHMKSATYETTDSTGTVTGTSYLDSNGLILGASTDTTAARFTKNAISAGNLQITSLGSGLGNTYTGTNENNAASIGDVNSLIGQYSQTLITVNGNMGTGKLGLGAVLNLQGQTSTTAPDLTNDYTTANLVTKTEAGDTSKDSTVTFYTKKDLVGRSLSLGDIGSDGTVTTPAAKLYTQAVSDTDSTLAGHLLLTGEARQGTGQSGYTSADFYVKDDVGSYLTDSNKPVTRVFYNDEAGIPYELANLKDGLHITGDNSTKADVELNKTLALTGGATGTLTSGNIGVTATQTTSGDTNGYNAGLNIQLADTLTNLKSIGFADSTVSIGSTGINAGGKAISDVLAGTEPTDAANVGQVNAAKAAATTELVAGSNVSIGTPTTAADGHKVYTVNANFSGADVSGSNAVVYDTFAKDKVTLGGSSTAPKVTLTNLKDGEISSTSTDAVTGKQLNDVITYRKQTINVKADSGSEVKLNHGNTLTISGDSNIKTSSSGSATASDGTLGVSLADNVYLKGIHIGSTYPTHSADSVDSVALTADDTNQTGILTLRGDATHVSNTYPRAVADISVISAAPGQTYMAAPFLQEVYQTSSSGTTTRNQPVRLAYRDNYSTAHQIATLDDGYIFSGDNGDKNLTEKLNGTVALRGMDNEHAVQVTSDTADTYLTKNNIGVVTKSKVLNEDGSTQDGQVQIRLAKDLTGLTSATFTNDNGDTAVIDAKNLKLTLNAQAEGKSPVSLTSNGLDNGNNQIKNVAAGTADADAVNFGQIKSIINSTDGSVKGLSFAGDSGSTTKYLGNTLQIFGGTDADSSHNIITSVKDGTLYVDLNRNLQVDELHVGQKDSDVASLTAATATLTDGSTSTFGLLKLKGVGTAQANVAAVMGTASLNNRTGDTTTRLTYNNGNIGNTHELAILEDGLQFAGDNYVAASGNTAAQNLVKKQLDQTLSITGGQTDMNALTALSDGNIGVVGDATNGTLNVRLSKSLHGLMDIYMGDTAAEASHLDKTGLYLSLTSSTEYKAKFTADNGISAGDQQIKHVADGQDISDAATVGQLRAVESKANNATTLTVNHRNANGSLTLTDTLDDDKIHHNYDIALSDTVTVGSSGTSITLDGTRNTINGGSCVQFGGNTSSTGTTTSPLAIGWQSAAIQKLTDGSDGGSQTGNYLTGLSNTSWDPLKVGYSPSRAATEGQLASLEQQIAANPITFLGNHDADKTAAESSGVKANLGQTVRIIGTGDDSATYDTSNVRVIAGTTADGTNPALLIQLKDTPSFTGLHIGALNAEGKYPVNLDADGLKITDGPSVTKTGINGGGKQLTNLHTGGTLDEKTNKITYGDDVGTNAATIQDVRNIAAQTASDTVESKKVTVVDNSTTGDNNIAVENVDGNSNHYRVRLNSLLRLGKDSKNNDNITIDGNNAMVTVGSGSTGNNQVTIDGNAGTVTIGNGTSGHSQVTISGQNGTVTGLTNTSLSVDGFATKGRAATEEQLQEAMNQANQTAQQNDTHVKADTYHIGDDHRVTMNVVDGTGTSKGSVVIDNVAKASDIGDVSQIDADIQNKEKNNIVKSLNNLNKKVKDAASGSWESQIDGTKVQDVHAGDHQNFESGDNIQLSNDNGAIKISTKKDVSFDKVTIGSGDSAVTVDKDGLQTGKVKVSSTEINAGGNRIQNVADGTEKTDAATVGQLQSVAGAAGQAIESLGNHVNRLDTRINRVGAGAAALAGLHPMETDGKWSMSMGFGNYRNANAVAVGTFYRPTDNLQFSLGGTLGNGENMISAGMSIALDRNPAVTGMTKAAMAREIRSLKQDNKAKDAQVKDLQSQVDTLKKENEDTKAKLAMIMAKLGM